MSESITFADAALVYAEHGWPVFPANSRTKRPLIKTGRDHAEHASRDAEQIKWWFDVRYPDAAIAMPTGAASGVVVIDADAKHDGERLLSQLEQRYGELPRNYVVRTQSGGIHVYCAHPGAGVRVKSCVGGDSSPWPERGVDIRGDGGIVLLPPSVGYTWEHDEGCFAPLPNQWLAVLRADARRVASAVTLPPVEYTGLTDDAHLTEYRARLAERRRMYRTGTRDGDPARGELLDRVLEGRALGALGERDSAVTRAGYLIGVALPEVGPDVAEQLAFASLAKIPVPVGDHEDLAHWCTKFCDSYEAGAQYRREQHERDRQMWARIARSVEGLR